jgi:hypothetical protein
MRYQKPLLWLVPLIGALALIAAGAGLLWQTEGAPYPLTSYRGEAVTILGRGIYRYDTVSTAAQEQATDLVTLVLALPLLGASTWLALRGSLRGQLLQTGTLGYMLYTYMSMSFLTAYNELFLIYVALFSLSLFAFILSMLGYDLGALPGRFSERLPRRAVAGVLFAAGGFLVLAWLGRIAPTLTQGQLPPLENTTTLVIQAMDLGLIAPLCFLGGALLLRRSPWGYLLAPVAAMKMLTLGAAVSVMALNMLRVGAAISLVEVLVFPGLTLANLVVAALILRSAQGAGPLAHRAQPRHA